MRSIQDVILNCFWDASCDREDAIPSRPDRPKSLFHYTGRDSAISILQKIIESGGTGCGFAFTDYRFLNDNREFRLGLDIAKIWMERYVKDIQEDLRKAILRNMVDRKGTPKLIPYVLSFSKDKDSTAHWAAYTNHADGGYSIGLKFGDVENSIKAYNESTRNNFESESAMPIVFAPCIYCNMKDMEDMKASNEVSSEMERVFSQCIAGISYVIYVKDTEKRAQWFAKRIFQIASLVKSDEFRFEKEWRLVARRDNDVSANVKIIGGKPRVLPSALDLGSCISEVVASPQGDAPRLKLLAEILCAQLPRKILVRPSKSSYNGK